MDFALRWVCFRCTSTTQFSPISCQKWRTSFHFGKRGLWQTPLAEKLNYRFGNDEEHGLSEMRSCGHINALRSSSLTLKFGSSIPRQKIPQWNVFQLDWVCFGCEWGLHLTGMWFKFPRQNCSNQRWFKSGCISVTCRETENHLQPEWGDSLLRFPFYFW